MLPPAPTMFSTVTGTFHASLNLWAKIRAVMSVALPGVKPTIIRTCLFGYGEDAVESDWARAAAATTMGSKAPIRAVRTVMFIPASLPVLGWCLGHHGRVIF